MAVELKTGKPKTYMSMRLTKNTVTIDVNDTELGIEGIEEICAQATQAVGVMQAGGIQAVFVRTMDPRTANHRNDSEVQTVEF